MYRSAVGLGRLVCAGMLTLAIVLGVGIQPVMRGLGLVDHGSAGARTADVAVADVVGNCRGFDEPASGEELAFVGWNVWCVAGLERLGSASCSSDDAVVECDSEEEGATEEEGHDHEGAGRVFCEAPMVKPVKPLRAGGVEASAVYFAGPVGHSQTYIRVIRWGPIGVSWMTHSYLSDPNCSSQGPPLAAGC